LLRSTASQSVWLSRETLVTVQNAKSANSNGANSNGSNSNSPTGLIQGVDCHWQGAGARGNPISSRRPHHFDSNRGCLHHHSNGENIRKAKACSVLRSSQKKPDSTGGGHWGSAWGC